jgi:Na+/phosphate symporter
MYIVSAPPYFLFIVGLVVSLTCGAAFDSVLKQGVQDWNKNRSTPAIATLQGVKLALPFLGIACGVCMFLSAGMAIFGFPFQFAFVMAVILTIFTGLLVWFQLSKILVQIEKGGSQALELDI